MTDRDDIIEELYSLEQSWRGGLPSRSVNLSAADEATNACADELADLIKELTEVAHLVQNDGRGAELGQEVGAVADAVEVLRQKLANDEDGWRALCVVMAALPTSHTSEARDSERLDWLERFTSSSALLLHNGEGSGSGFTGLGLKNTNRTLRQAIDAAMRQDGGE